MWSSAATWRAKPLPGKVQREGRSEESEKLRLGALFRNIGSFTAGLGSGSRTYAVWACLVRVAVVSACSQFRGEWYNSAKAANEARIHAPSTQASVMGIH